MHTFEDETWTTCFIFISACNATHENNNNIINNNGKKNETQVFARRGKQMRKQQFCDVFYKLIIIQPNEYEYYI